MSKKELGRVGVLARVKSEELGVVDAAQLLRVSYRQAKRLWKRFREEGAAGLQHGSAGRPSNRAHDKKFRKKVLRLVRAKYGGAVGERFGPPRAAERDRIFRLESERTGSEDWVVRYDNRFFQLQPQSRYYAPAQSKVLVCEGRHGTLAIEYRGRPLRWQEIPAPARPSALDAEPKRVAVSLDQMSQDLRYATRVLRKSPGTKPRRSIHHLRVGHARRPLRDCWRRGPR